MGFRGGMKSGGGGFWNNVDVTVKSMDFSAIGPGQKKAGDYVFLVPTVRVDGQDKDTDSHLFLGSLENYEIAKDGKSVTYLGRDGKGSERTEFQTKGKKGFLGAGHFIETLLDAGFPEDELPDLEAGEPLSLEAVEGYRLRLVQEVDELATKTQGKRKDDKGQSWDRTTPIVTAVYGKEGAATATKGTASNKAGAKGAKADKGADALAKQTDDAVVAVIESNVTKTNKTGATPVAKLSMGVFRIVKGDNKDAVRKLVNSDNYVSEAVARGAFQYDEENEAVFIEA